MKYHAVEKEHTKKVILVTSYTISKDQAILWQLFNSHWTIIFKPASPIQNITVLYAI